jgi:hypothetical protein
MSATPQPVDPIESTELDLDPATAPPTPRDAGNWAKTVTTLEVGDAPAEAVNLNVAGRRVTNPVQGFGKMWQKTFQVRLPGTISPERVIAEWKQHFPEFWPGKNRFYGNLAGISAGDVALINMSMIPGIKIATGVLVLYADELSFTVMTPQGHMFAGFNTFSAEQVGDETVVQISALIRASDPIFELSMVFGGHRFEEIFWVRTLANLATHFGVADPKPTRDRVCVDKRRQWKMWRNLWHNAMVRSVLHVLTAPVRALRRGKGQQEV